MSGRGILDADMATLGRYAMQGWRWWTAELAALVPAALRRGRGDRLPRIRYQDGVALAGPAILLLPSHLLLRRTIERPHMAARDVPAMLALEQESLLPYPADAMLIAGRIDGPAAEAHHIRIALAGLPIDAARAVALAVPAAPVRIVAEDDEALDFAPALRAAGLLPPVRSAAPYLWAFVAFLVALNLATLIWRDQASVDRLDQLVQDQQPAVAVARTITRRQQRDQQLIARTGALRRTHDPLAALTAVSETLPPGAWLQRYVWDGATLRLTGYRPAKVDVATALRRSGRFADVRSMTDETQATVPAGDPFDISARVVR